MSTARWLAATLVLAMAAGCAGTKPAAAPESTSTNTVAPAPWGEQAVAWFDALEEAAANGVEHLPPFIEVEVFNGTPELDGFLQWGFSRYEAAGLPLPQVSSVTFLHARAACYNLGGQALTTEGETSITLCRTPEDVCLDDTCDDWVASSRQLLLHELAHPWLDEHTDEATRAAFLEFVGLQRWADQDDPWQERGVERAADMLAFGLMDEPVEIDPEFTSSCEERTAGFRILTRTDPIAVCTPAPSSSLGR